MRHIAIDIESIGLKGYGGTIWSLTITEKNKTQIYSNPNGLRIHHLPKKVIDDLKSEDVCKVVHNGLFDGHYIELCLGIKLRNYWDTELDERVILGQTFSTQLKTPPKKGSYVERMLKKFNTALKFVLARYKLPVPDKEIRKQFIDRPIGVPFTKEELRYMKMDVEPLLALQNFQHRSLISNNQLEVALLENTVLERYVDMKVRGIGFDEKIWRNLYNLYCTELKKRLAKLPKEVTNWNSPKQVKEYFYNRGILIDSYENLDEIYLATRNKTLGEFIFAKELQKAVTTYGINWFDEEYINFKGEKKRGEGFIDGDGRIRCHITQIIATGRNSMAEPNLQQLPGKGNINLVHLMVMDLIHKQLGETKMQWRHREAFIPKPGHVFVVGDFSGQEIGIMAARSDENLWIDAMLRGEDVHGLTAYTIDPTQWVMSGKKDCKFPFKCECPLHQQLREPAKINNFMLAYGGGAGKFAKKTGKNIIDAIAYVSAHKRAIPKLTQWLYANGQNAIATGISYSADPYQRRRVLNGDEEWQIKNKGMNNPVQSAGANMLKLAMVSLPWEYPIVLVIHDEIICEVPIKQAKKCLIALKQVMEKSADYITGIKGLIKVDPKIKYNIMK